MPSWHGGGRGGCTHMQCSLHDVICDRSKTSSHEFNHVAACPHVPIVQTLPVRVIDPSSVVDITGCATTPVTAQATRPRVMKRTMLQCLPQSLSKKLVSKKKSSTSFRLNDFLIFAAIPKSSSIEVRLDQLAPRARPPRPSAGNPAGLHGAALSTNLAGDCCGC
jgi:hypothetical protein